ncbi:hypothetical protein [Salinimicrobium terrae]|uniref:hypothetical protein n=1 Tax=Salinimicrobium terrae TaxID=470866 RepID=UPI000423E10C|nr:hypothetical protein [Salinimicrobium terrae]
MKDFIQKNKFISLLIIISLISSLRNLFLPLFGDEKTYANIANNIIVFGQYFHNGQPTTVTPSLPFLMALFYTKIDPTIGFVITKLANLGFIILGVKFLYKFLKDLNLNDLVVTIVLLLTIVNNNFVLWSTLLYPESILFCFFWIFIYYLNKSKIARRDILLITASFLILILTRYVFAVLGLLIMIKLYPFLMDLIRSKRYKLISQLALYLGLMLIPVLLWFKYVYYIESENEIGLSYFNRFKDREPFYNIKAGLGLIKHAEVNNINGIPAFISLFVPMTGLRSWIFSLVLIISFISGFLIQFKNKSNRFLFFAVLLVMGGLVFAGTGFSRYWLFMLPAYILGFYYFFQKLIPEKKYFIQIGKILALIYVVNEIRLNFVIFTELL